MRKAVAAVSLTLLAGIGATWIAEAPSQAAPAAAPRATTFESLKLGSTGARVRQVQEKLRANGSTILADGIFGPKTRLAVIAFQKSKKLYVDGIVGPRTWKALGLDEASPEVTIPKNSYTHPNKNVERWHDDALAAGWSNDQWQKLSCIIQRESKGVPTAKNPRSSAMGLLQIMWSAHSRWIGGSSSKLYDGPTNLRLGHELFVRAGGWRPWTGRTNSC
jgi:hypothetical protein